MIECVINISEGRDLDLVEEIALAAGNDLLDVHCDPDHNRSVLTVIGAAAPAAVIRAAVQRLDLRSHEGVHPRIGVVDVVPFVPLTGSTFEDALTSRDASAWWIADELRVPVFLYGPERTLPDVRRGAFTTIRPDFGPPEPHPTAGAVAVGARNPLLAWNLWLSDASLEQAKQLAASLRGPGLRALGLQVGDQVQVSMNLIDPLHVGPAEAYDIVAASAKIERAELVGLIPKAVLETVEPKRWEQLNLSIETTIEFRLER
ncbi:MAG: glutamate formiminotransferase [Actinobacteria bacterium]|nr:glutamate formiminotransferase [Actinomycetota bacterium]